MTSQSRLLVREAIGSALGRYFSRSDFSPVIAQARLDFSAMRGEADYKQRLSELYRAGGGGFLTPSEIFAPWYSYGIARWMLREGLGPAPRIVEFGGGNGTLAAHLLDYLKSAAPTAYDAVRYVNLDISRPLADVAQRNNRRHGHRYRSVVDDDDDDDEDDDAADSRGPVFVLALELLDNLPHDKVRWERCDGSWRAVEQARVVVDSSSNTPPREVFEPLTDRWIQQAAAISVPQRGESFVPTGALRWLHRVKSSYPRHRLFVADFDALPAPSLLRSDPAANAPLVAAPDGRDLGSYLDALDGSADIFFATDFNWLARAYALLDAGAAEPDLAPVQAQKSADFFRPFALPCRTKTGYNPLLADFSNTSVLLRGGGGGCHDEEEAARRTLAR